MKRIPKDILESFLLKKYNNINGLQNNDAPQNLSASHTIQKWDANCEAESHVPAPFLWLRKNVFYCRIELPRVNGKRRYKRFSLHTSDYYEARALMDKQKQLAKDLQELHKFFNQLDFIEPTPFPYKPSSSNSPVTIFYTKTIDV